MMANIRSKKIASRASKHASIDPSFESNDTRETKLTKEINLPEVSEALVLASGGLDSSTLLALLISLKVRPTSLFIDYQQNAASAEEAAIISICQAMDVPLRIVRYKGAQFGAGEIRGRNAFLLHTGLLEFPAESGVIVMGIHAGTGYIDCSPEFIELMQRSFDLHTGGLIEIVTPFLTWSKGDIGKLAIDLAVPVDSTYSCESGNQPCGSCRSCIDSRSLQVEQVDAGS